MFGYINANKKTMTEEQEKLYRSYYCGLCRKLKELGGRKAQLFLNYDITFLILVLSGLYEIPEATDEFTCTVHPGSKRTSRIGEATSYGAAMDLVLSYHSLMDDFQDTGSRVKRSYALSLRKQYNEIREQYPRQCRAVEKLMDDTVAAEARREPNLDIVSGYTGEALAEIFDWKEDELWSDDLRTMGYYLGKFIYLIDAYDDLPSDEQNGRYNPLIFCKKDSEECFETFIQSALTSMIAESARAFERMPILRNADLIRNILYSGVWTKYEYLRRKRSGTRNPADDKDAAE